LSFILKFRFDQVFVNFAEDPTPEMMRGSGTDSQYLTKTRQVTVLYMSEKWRWKWEMLSAKFPSDSARFCVELPPEIGAFPTVHGHNRLQRGDTSSKEVNADPRPMLVVGFSGATLWACI